MKLTAAPAGFLFNGDNRSGVYQIVRVAGLASHYGHFRYDFSDPVMTVRVRSNWFDIKVGAHPPRIGDIIASIFTPHSRFNPGSTQFYVIGDRGQSESFTSKQVTQQFTLDAAR